MRKYFLMLVNVYLVVTVSSCGPKHKIDRSYWDNGVLQTKLSFNQQDELDGICEKYYPNSVLHSRCRYSSNRLLEIVKLQDTCGRAIPFNFKSGNGCVVELDGRGFKNMRGCFKNGLKQGKWYLLNGGEDVIGVTYYKDGISEFGIADYLY